MTSLRRKIAHNLVDKEVTEVKIEADYVSPEVDVEIACNVNLPRFFCCLKLTDEEQKVSIPLFVSFLKAMRERSRDVGVAFCCVCLVLLPSVESLTWTAQPSNQTEAIKGQHVSLTWRYSLTADELTKSNSFLNIKWSKFNPSSSTYDLFAVRSKILNQIATYSEPSAPRIVIDRATGTNFSSLQIDNVRLEDEGSYKIEISVEFPGTVIAAYDVVNLTVSVPPEIVFVSNDSDVCEGSNVSLSCNATGVPPPSITWTRVGDDGKDSAPLSTVDGSYIMNNISRSASGTYRCTARNPAGTVNRTVQVMIRYSASVDGIVTSNSSNIVTEGGSFNMSCEASGDPMPLNYAWIKDNKQQDNDMVLHLDNISRDDAGEYRCEVENRCGKDSKSLAVVVYYPPFVTENILTINTISGDPKTLSCPVGGFPAPNITWHEGNDTSGKERFYGTNWTFPFESNDAGWYICFAKNHLGNVSATFRLIVEQKPKSTTPSTTQAKGKRHSGELLVEKINRDKAVYTEEYNDLNKAVTKRLTDPFKKKMDETFANEPHYEKTEVTKLSDRNGSVIVSFDLFFTTPVTANEAFTKLRSVIVNGTFGPFQVGTLTVVSIPTTTPTKPASATTEVEPCEESFFKKEDCSVKLAVAVGISVAAVLLIAIIAVAVGCWIRKERKCRKDIRIAHHPGCEEQRLQGGDPNAQVNNGYAETGPPSANITEKAAAAVPDYTVVDKSTKTKKKQDEEKPPEYAVEDKSKKKKKNEKVDDTYAKVDMSKKRSKKKPRPGEDVVYADLGDINGTSQMPAVATSPKAQLHPLKRSEGYEGTQYADITQFLKGDATLPKDEKQGTEMKEKDEKTDRAGGENAPKGTLM